MRYLETSKQYFGVQIRVWRVYPLSCPHPYPWRFSTQASTENRETLYIGIPNQCSSVRSALKRAWYRAKWISEGIMHKHYR